MSKSIVVSGGFDPIHIGHVRMILEASLEGEVVVVANSDDWLIRKKGFCFMPWEERAEIIHSIRGVSDVVRVDDSDNSVCEAIKRLHSEHRCDTFANGGDRTDTNTPEKDLCEKLGIEMIWSIGGGKIQSSSTLVDRASVESKSFKNFLKRG
jgi:D-beta-D-heptose 7-phosphate kinase/D-beta-D-heptose 1-phosphate adenosyltransferase